MEESGEPPTIVETSAADPSAVKTEINSEDPSTVNVPEIQLPTAEDDFGPTSPAPPAPVRSIASDDETAMDEITLDESSASDAVPTPEPLNQDEVVLEEKETTQGPPTNEETTPREESLSKRSVSSPLDSLPQSLAATTVLYNSEETPKETIARLREGLRNGSLAQSDVVDSLFHLLVGGVFDLETRFIIEEPGNIAEMIELLDECPPAMQAEVWSVFVAIVRKSARNRAACSRVGLISALLERLPSASPLVADLLVQLLGTLTNYSITVKETKRFLKALQATDDRWPRNSLKLLQVMLEMPKRDGADVFFSFPGKAQAGIILPPLARFPGQSGWTFSTWFRMDPLNSVTFEKELPYLYSFRTSKGVGYSAYFTGNCLVIQSEKAKGKPVAKCIKEELTPRKWHHVAIAHSYARWTTSEIKCFLDGQLVETIDMNWMVSASETFDRCAIGVNADAAPGDASSSFCGQMGAVYVFGEALSLQQANSLYCLGPAYQSYFKHDAESQLPDGYKRHLFDGRLHASLIVAYSPKNTHGQLCLHAPPKSTAGFFVQIPHAVMKQGVEVVTTHSIHSSLQSVGGIQILLPLFSQLDLPQEDGDAAPNTEICSTLLSLISQLLSSSPTSQQQLFHSKGFLIIAHALQKASTRHLTMNVLERMIAMAKFLLTCPAGIPLLKQLFDHILFNPRLWIHSDPKVQVHLYTYLCTDFLANANFPAILRRVPIVIEMIHAIKHYYWLVPPSNTSNYQVEQRSADFSTQDVVAIRGSILTFVSRLVTLPSEDDNRDEELHTLLNFIATVHEDDNLYDVLSLTTRLLAEQPASMVPAFDRNKALSVVFKLLGSPNELIRIPALKMFGYFLSRSTLKRKTDSVGALNLFTLIADRLLLSARGGLSLASYNVLFEILVEQMTPGYTYTEHHPPSLDARFENPTMLKVIANLITQSEEGDELWKVKKVFLLDIINMCRDSRENRRTILQMSVWQEWLISLAPIFPQAEHEQEISELVFEAFSILLHHAIRSEYGGWRVWVDTLAIAHSKVSWERFRANSSSANSTSNSPSKLPQLSSAPPPGSSKTAGTEIRECVNNLVEAVVEAVDGSSPRATLSIKGNEEKPSSIYRTPEFCWSKVHLRLLTDLLTNMENVVEEWKSSGTSLIDHVNATDNQVFVANAVHVISQLTDSLIMACGGLLPLLAAATSPNSELEIVDATQQELPMESAASLLGRFVALADVFIFVSGVSFAELEQEKNMPNGGILRQTLRLVATTAVRHILACRYEPGQLGSPSVQSSPKLRAKLEAIEKFVMGALEAKGKEGILDVDRLLQEVDLQRIKGIVYRDMEENRQAQFLALAVIYLLSVLMVSRYRDILEPPASPSPFFDSTTNAKEATVSSSSTPNHNGYDEENSKTNGAENNGEMKEKREDTVSSTKVAPGALVKDGKEYGASELKKLEGGSRGATATGERRAYLTDKLQAALETTAPLLREIMGDFRSFFQKTLLGTHGQEIMNDAKVMATLKNRMGSVVELVMLLCSQEWQTSLQKHAGLAFIELVNEGRLMAHATRDHILRVSNEADFILNRLRAEDVSKHAQFEGESRDQLLERGDEERRCDHVIRASRRRDALVAAKLLDKMTTILRSPSGAWSQDDKSAESPQMFWRLDVWEDDSRRRKRFVPNAYGSRYLEAAVGPQTKKENEEDEASESRRLKELAQKVGGGGGGGPRVPADLVDESDFDKWGSEAEPPPHASESTSYSTTAKLIAPGIVVPGTLSITATDLYFDADEDSPLYKQQDPRCLRFCESLHGRWNLQEIRAIFLRRYLQQNTALELFLASRTAIMFAFNDAETVRRVVAQLPRVGVGVKYGLPQSRKTSLMSARQLFRRSDMCAKWQRREISNFDYLMFLNTVAGRTFNDLNQYPVFPWILANYDGENLDLNQASNFRDLSKPVGALSEGRRKHFQERYNAWDDDKVPPFHYGTHYSTQAFTVNWLYRVEPFTSQFLSLQSGKFDQPDRLFHSLSETWENCQRDTHDVKELIPELFFLPEMFRNSNGYPLGKRADGTPVGDVKLPKWAKSSEHFVVLHRQALESDLVSCQLNQWIDLIFGYKQKGPEAVRATNVFYYLTYEGAVDLANLEPPSLREAVEAQILAFGQTPAQLLTEAHPPRHSVMTMTPLMFKPLGEDLCMLMKFISNSAIVHLSANTFSQLPNPTVLSVAANRVFALNKWDNNYSFGTQSHSPLAMSEGKNSAETVIDPSALPLSVDPLLASGNPSQPPARRHLGDAFDHRLVIRSNNFVATTDSRVIIACGYPDYSFRVIDTETARVKQVVYGHGDTVVCLARSETSLYADCYVASGSLDCTVALWHWNAHSQAIAGEYNMPGEPPAPRAILTGHDSQITAIAVSAEHGLVISGSEDGTTLLHTTQGDLLRRVEGNEPVTQLLVSRECVVLIQYGARRLVTITTTGRRLDETQAEGKTECATLTRDGEYVVTGRDDGRVDIFRLFPLQHLYQFKQLDCAVRCVAVTANHKFVLAGLESGAVVVFNVDFNRWHFEYKLRYEPKANRI